MPDQKRTECDLLQLFADNHVGRITAQNMRDFIVSTQIDQITNHLANLDSENNGLNKYSALIGDDICSSINIPYTTHGCAPDRTNVARINDEETGAEVDCSIIYKANGDVEFIFYEAISCQQYRIVIIG